MFVYYGTVNQGQTTAGWDGSQNVGLKPVGPVMKIVSSKFLFQTHAIGGAGNIDVSADGSRIIINTQDEEQISPPVWLVSNWTQLLNKKMK